MSVKRLEDFFSGSDCSRALSTYARTATDLGWSIPHKIDLYARSKIAFDDRLQVDQRQAAFREIYDSLAGYWQVFRPYGPQQRWDSQKVFETISREFEDFWPIGHVSLLNFESDKWGEKLTKALQPLRDIKPNEFYPVMTVSKFLHFFNPSLFLIWDTAVIDNRVLKRFWSDYLSYCSEFELNSRAIGIDFIKTYTRWASSIMTNGAEECMPLFCEWLPSQLVAVAGEPYPFDKLYATAFEFIAIGATVLEGQ